MFGELNFHSRTPCTGWTGHALVLAVLVVATGFVAAL
jgi:hypothetical protein